jgi:5,6,7,8-tetrahydromethanopterin hydro-lyase
MTMHDPFDGRIGEAWAGEVPNGSHVNVVLARRGSVTAAAIVTLLGSPSDGRLPVLACLSGGDAVRPATVIVNKVALGDGPHVQRLTWGAAQLGIAQGVLDVVAEGGLPSGDIDDTVVLVVVWVDPEAHDDTVVRIANRAAAADALRDALAGHGADFVAAQLLRRDAARNAYYDGE